MSLFKVLRGDSSRISTDITPFHDGWCYFTSDDGGFYIDVVDEHGEEKRTCINPKSTSIDVILESEDWSDKNQTIQIDGMKAAQNGLIGISQNNTIEQFQAASLAQMYVSNQQDGFLTITASGDVPACDISVTVTLIN